MRFQILSPNFTLRNPDYGDAFHFFHLFEKRFIYLHPQRDFYFRWSSPPSTTTSDRPQLGFVTVLFPFKMIVTYNNEIHLKSVKITDIADF